MAIHSMTGFAQVKGQITGQLGCTISLKAVNHRFLDLHLRMPPDTEILEMKLRRVLRERLHRGHIELTVALDRNGSAAIGLNRQVVKTYIEAFRTASAEFGVAADPDLN